MDGGEAAPAFVVRKLNSDNQEVWRYLADAYTFLPDGVRLEARFRRADLPTPYTTFKQGDRFVEYFYTDRWYNVFAVYDRDDARLKGWYCNLSRPAQVAHNGLHYADLALDVWVTPQGECLLLDEEEFAAQPLSATEQAQVQQALEQIQHLAQTGRLPR